MGLALLFPGQGAQHAHMLPWLDAQPEAMASLAALSAHLGRPWREGLGDPAWLHANRVAQLLLTGVGIAAWQVLAARLPRPVAVAGYSVGELAAFAVAGVFDAGAALDLAAARAQAMTDSVGGRPTGLMAVQGAHALSLAGPEADLSVAIRIGAQRVIVGGPAEVLDDAARRWSGAGLRCTRLPMAAVTLHPARSPVVCNFTGGTSRSLAVLAPALAGQIASTVRWDDCMDSIAERGVHCVLEVGPGTTLAAMWRERHPHLPVRSVDEFQGPEGVLRWVAQQPA